MINILKKLLLYFIISLPVLPTSACSNNDSYYSDGVWTVTDGITLRLYQDSYPPGTTDMTLIGENRSDSVMIYDGSWAG